MKKLVIASVSNNIQADQRLEKVCNSLIQHDFDVFLIGTTLRGNPKIKRPYPTKLLPIKFQNTFMFYIELNLKLFWQLLWMNKENAILLANDLDTLLPNFLITKIFGLKLVYDSHEIFTELPSLKGRRIPKMTWKLMERCLLPRVKYFYTVSDSYANWFKKEYGLNPLVVRNVPIFKKIMNVSKTDISLPKRENKEKIIIYQGAINQSRGIDKMILAMQYVNNAQLWIIGDGPMLKKYMLLAKEIKLYKQTVFFLGRVEPVELKKITPMADIGLSLEEDNGLSYRYALPNKVFDYIHAEVPVLGTCLDEISTLITKYKVGKVIGSHDPEQIAEKIDDLLSEGKEAYGSNFRVAQEKLNWQREEGKLILLYEAVDKEHKKHNL